MKILMVTNLFQPDFCGGAALITDLAEGLQERGHEVTVFGPYPYYPEWADKSGDNSLSIRHETHQGIDLWRHGIYIPRDPGKLLPRLAYELSFAFSLLRSLFRGPKQDVTMVFCPLFGSVLFAVLRKWLRRERLWLTIQDIPADAASAAGISKSKVFDAIAGQLQKFVFNRADAWSSINQSMVDRLETMKRSDIPLHFFPNWLTGPQAQAVEQFAQKSRNPPGDPVRLLYCGNIGKKQGLLAFCQWLSQIDRDSDFQFAFEIRGEGSAAQEIKDWIDTTGDARFSMHGFLDDDEFIATIHSADWFVITEKAGAGFSFLPSKLIPCISVGTPVLCVCDSDGPLGQEVADHELGLGIPWSELEQLPEKLKAASEPAAYAASSKACLDRSVAYQRRTAITNYESAIEQLKSPDPSKG